MKKVVPLHPFLSGVYPIAFLYALMPGGVPIAHVLPPLFLQCVIVAAIWVSAARIHKDSHRAAVTTVSLSCIFLPPATFIGPCRSLSSIR